MCSADGAIDPSDPHPTSLRAGRQRVDLRVGRKAAEGVPRQREPAVDADVELTRRPLDQLDGANALGLEPIPRTEGLGLIPSPAAILDPDVHGMMSALSISAGLCHGRGARPRALPWQRRFALTLGASRQ